MGVFQRLGAGDDFQDLRRDRALPDAVVLARQVVDHLGGAVGRAFHGDHARGLFARERFNQRPVSHDLDILRQECVQQRLGFRFKLVRGARVLLGLRRLLQRQQLNDRRCRLQHGDELRVPQKQLIVFAAAVVAGDLFGDRAKFLQSHIARRLCEMVGDGQAVTAKIITALLADGNQFHFDGL